jgi:hypothetical protein
MQLVTPSVVAMVVSMAIANCTMVFQISFFFILHIKFRISELRNREALAERSGARMKRKLFDYFAT